MAYKRRYKRTFRKKKYGARNTSKGRVVPTVTTAQATANRALAIAKKIRGNIEYKHEEYTLGFDAPYKVNSDGNIAAMLSNIDRGDTIHQRVGDYISLARLSGRVRFMLSKLAGTNPDGYLPTRSYRIIIFRGIRENGVPFYTTTSQSTESGILYDGPQGAQALLPIVCRKDDTNMRRTKFLFDKTYTLGGGKDTQRIHNFNFPVRWKAQFTHDSGEDLVADGGLYMMFLTDTDGVGSGNAENAIFMDLNMRVTYSDF